MIRIISTVLIIITVNVVMMLVNNQQTDVKDGDLIRLPKIYLWIGCICLFVFTSGIVLMTIFPNDTAEWWVYLIMSMFCLLSLSVIVAYLNWFIVLNENSFNYRTFWRKLYQISYVSVEKCKVSENIIIIQIEKKRFFIDPHAIGIDNFINKIKKQ